MSKRWVVIALMVCSVLTGGMEEASARGVGSLGTMGSRGMTAGNAVTAISASPGSRPQNHTCVVTDGTVHCWGHDGEGQLGDGTTTARNTPVQVQGLTNAVAVAVGAFHTCALRADGLVACWGDDRAGQLGDGAATSQGEPVLAGVIMSSRSRRGPSIPAPYTAMAGCSAGD